MVKATWLINKVLLCDHKTVYSIGVESTRFEAKGNIVAVNNMARQVVVAMRRHTYGIIQTMKIFAVT